MVQEPVRRNDETWLSCYACCVKFLGQAGGRKKTEDRPGAAPCLLAARIGHRAAGGARARIKAGAVRDSAAVIRQQPTFSNGESHVRAEAQFRTRCFKAFAAFRALQDALQALLYNLDALVYL